MPRRVFARLSTWLDARREAALTQRRVLHGIAVSVYNLRTDISVERLFERTEAALALIAHHDPRRFRRLARDLARIDVRRGMTRGAYMHANRSCILDNTFVANPKFSEVEVAACIVHEAMHARVATMGVRRLAKNAAREERVCRRAEIAFAELVPGGEPVIARASAVLAAPDDHAAPAIDYDEVRRRVLAADLHALAAPRWLKHVIARRNGITLPPA